MRQKIRDAVVACVAEHLISPAGREAAVKAAIVATAGTPDVRCGDVERIADEIIHEITVAVMQMWAAGRDGGR